MITTQRLDALAARLLAVPGIRAVVLGGSRALGTHTPTSDHDLGLYYDPDGLDVDALAAAASALADAPVTVAGPGAWGPWVDGGAWLTVDGEAVDLILRDLGRVQGQCERALSGQFAFHPQPGHPLGFLDLSYAGEVAVCRPLADPDAVVADLKRRLTPYPDNLARAFAADLWQAGFLLDGAAKGADRGDVTHVALCCSTAALICAHAWHAAAGRWALGEKGLVPAVANLPVDSGTFVADATAALAHVGRTTDDLDRAIATMRRAADLTTARLQPRPAG